MTDSVLRQDDGPVATVTINRPEARNALTAETKVTVAAGPTLAFAAIKESLAYSAVHGLAESLEKEAELQTGLGNCEDHRSATAAFVAKKAPMFSGR